MPLSTSIVIVTRNRSATLRRCVEYILQNTLLPNQIVIVDSSDTEDQKIVSWIKKTLERHHILLSYKHILHFTVSHSRNISLELIESDITSFLDDDEYVPPDWLEKIVTVFRTQKKLQGFWGPNLPSTPVNYWHQVWQKSLEYDWQKSAKDVLPTIGNAHYRTSFLKKHDLKFDTRFQTAEDKVFALGVKKHTSIQLISDVWVHHEYRHTFLGFIKQWRGYGKGIFLFNHLYVYKPTSRLRSIRNHISSIFSSLRFLRHSYQTITLTRDLHLFWGVLVRDVAFLFGYAQALFAFLFSATQPCILYLSSAKDLESINWIKEGAQTIAQEVPLLYFPYQDIYTPISASQLFQLKNISNIFTTFTHILQNRFAQWRVFFFLPLTRFNSVRELNITLNIWLIKIFFQRNRKMVVIAQHPHSLTQRIIAQLQPYFVMSECGDYWTTQESHLARSYSHTVLTNSLPLFEYHTQHGPAKLISAGYFSQRTIKDLYKKSVYQKSPPTLLFIATITWRIDFQLLLFLVKKFPQYQFLFVGTELFEYQFGINDKKEFVQHTQIAQATWRKILKQKNVQFHQLPHQGKLASLKLKATTGLISLDMSHPFNQYCHPVKFYHYLALGVSVVSHSIPSLEKYTSPYLKLCEDRQDFVQAIRQLVKKKVPRSVRRKMYNEALSQTFEAKRNDITAIITMLHPYPRYEKK